MKNFDAIVPTWAGVLRAHPGQAFLLEVPRARQADLLRGLKAWLLCPAASGGASPCGSCLACRDEPHPDWLLVGGQQGRIRRAQVTAFGELALVPPRQGSTRLFVIHEPEWLGEEAANSLLKLLEESPPHATWVLVTDRPHDVLPTVRSRCRPLAWREGRLRAEVSEEVARLLRGEFAGADWPERLPELAQAIREALRDPRHVPAMAEWPANRLIRAWDLIVDAYQALEHNANRELWVWRLREVWHGRG
ncbi:MAG: hypothetical protein K6V97_09905 [Actinomycetia bacterium]|nr:hypothetical protein [Actinomycetes bacterium]